MTLIFSNCISILQIPENSSKLNLTKNQGESINISSDFTEENPKKIQNIFNDINQLQKKK